jgi:hypothetical protein
MVMLGLASGILAAPATSNPPASTISTATPPQTASVYYGE